jgi:hypothetical protein
MPVLSKSVSSSTPSVFLNSKPCLSISSSFCLLGWSWVPIALTSLFVFVYSNYIFWARLVAEKIWRKEIRTWILIMVFGLKVGIVIYQVLSSVPLFSQ